MKKLWLGVVIMMFSVSSHAVLPTEATDAFATLVTDTASFMGLLWTLVPITVVGFIIIKLFKKGINKAT